MVNNEANGKACKTLYSKLSFTFSALTLILFILLVNSIPSTIKANEGFPIIPKWLILTAASSCFLGFIFCIISLIRKERLKYLKVIGGVLNILLFLFLIGIIGFAIIMDWRPA